MLEVLILEYVTYVRRHHVANFRLTRVATFGHEPNGNITVRKHPNKPIPLCDRQDAGVLLAHHLRDVSHGLVRAHHFDVAAHHVRDLLCHSPVSPISVLPLVLRHMLLKRPQCLVSDLPHCPNNCCASLQQRMQVSAYELLLKFRDRDRTGHPEQLFCCPHMDIYNTFNRIAHRSRGFLQFAAT